MLMSDQIYSHDFYFIQVINASKGTWRVSEREYCSVWAPPYSSPLLLDNSHEAPSGLVTNATAFTHYVWLMQMAAPRATIKPSNMPQHVCGATVNTCPTNFSIKGMCTASQGSLFA